MLVPLTPFLWSIVQVTLLAIVALMISWLLRGRRPQWTSAMLAGASVAAISLTALAWLPVSHWSVATLTKNNIVPSSADAARGHKVPLSTPAADPNPSSAPTDTLVNPMVEPTHSPALRTWIATATSWLSFQVQDIEANWRNFESHTARKSVFVWRVQMLGLLVVIILGGLWLHSWLWIRSIVRHSVAIADSDTLTRLKTLATRMGLSRLPQLLESDKVAMGATVGSRRQRLILNPQWKQWSDEELEVVLLHELAHMVRNDFVWVVIGSWIRMLLFYHPLVHLLVRRWRMEQELAADQLAAGAMESARAYGRALARLALRSQGGAKVPSPALTAEQVCIVRRITMLKQGSLKPLKNRGRWSAVVIALTCIVTVPLSSLRGTPPSTTEPQTASTPKSGSKPTAVNSSKESSVSPDELRKLREEYQLTQKEFPPLSYVGHLKWEPGLLLTDDVQPILPYMQDLVSFALFEQFREQLKIQAPAYATLKWETRQRERALLLLGATCNEWQGIDPKFILRLLTNPRVENYKLTSETKLIAGREGLRLTAETAANDAPSRWFVQDGDSSYFGTEQEIVEQIERKQSTDSDANLAKVPEAFRQDYTQAAFALVYDDCEQWSDRIRDYFAGSSKQANLIFIQPYFKGLKQIGVFLTGQGGVTLNIRVGYQSEAAAKDGAEAIEALVGLYKAEADADLLKLLNGLQLHFEANEVRVSLTDAKLVDSFCQAILPEKITGWTDILSMVESSDVPGTVKLWCRDQFALTGFLAQSIHAKNYRGQRVRVSAEIGGSEDVHSRCGTIIWGSDDQLRTVGNTTSGKTIGKPVDTQKVLTLWNKPIDETIVWHTRTVEWNVPANAQALSFGVYLAAGEVQVRNLKFEVVGPATNGQSETELVDLPRNLMQIPGRKLLEQPTNLDFSNKPASVDSSTVQTADRQALPELRGQMR